MTQQLELGCSLGIVLVPGEHRNITEFQHLKIIDIAKGSIDSEGPDLSFIVLPYTKVSEIKPYKNFYDLTVDKDRMLNKPPDVHGGIWLLCGTVGERTKEETSSKGFGKIMSFEGLCAIVGVDRLYRQDDFDYIEADVEYGKGLDVPNTFGGVSGGSLWQVPVKKNDGGKLETVSYFLSGVAFYESEIKETKRFIKCHGRESIYQHAYHKIISALGTTA